MLGSSVFQMRYWRIASSFACVPFVAAAQLEVVEENAPSSSLNGAYSDCPCLDYQEYIRINASNLALADSADTECQDWDDVSCLGHQDNISINTNALAMYGFSECRAWDSTHSVFPKCTTAPSPLWCNKSWCYVHSLTCKRHTHQSMLHPGIHYSYTTCGNLNELYARTISSNTKRQLFVYAGGGGARMDPVPRKTDAVAIQSALLGFAYHWLLAMRINPENVKYRKLSDASLARSSSNFTACVHDIALGNIDLCVGGGWWDTDERRGMRVPFSGQIFSDDMHFVAFQKGESLLMRCLKPFMPFTWTLWLFIFSVLLASGVAISIFELREEGEYENQSVFRAIVMGWYHALRSAAAGGEPLGQPKTLSGRVFELGLGFYVLVVLTLYTASLSSWMVADIQMANDVSLDMYIHSGKKICHAPGFTSTLKEMFPKLKRTPELLVEVDTLGMDVPKYMIEGKCEGGIMSYWIIREHWGVAEHCDLRIIDVPVMSMPAGFFVASDLATIASWALARKRADGIWNQISQSVLPKNLCKSKKSTDNMQLDPSYMVGTSVVLLVSFLIAIVVRTFEIDGVKGRLKTLVPKLFYETYIARPRKSNLESEAVLEQIKQAVAEECSRSFSRGFSVSGSRSIHETAPDLPVSRHCSL